MCEAKTPQDTVMMHMNLFFPFLSGLANNVRWALLVNKCQSFLGIYIYIFFLFVFLEMLIKQIYCIYKRRHTWCKAYILFKCCCTRWAAACNLIWNKTSSTAVEQLNKSIIMMKKLSLVQVHFKYDTHGTLYSTSVQGSCCHISPLTYYRRNQMCF